VFQISKWVIWARFRHISFNFFQWGKELFKPMGFGFYNCVLKIRESIWDFNSHNGSSFGSEVSFPHTHCILFTLRSMWGDSRASLLARNLISPYFGHEPKARIVTTIIQTMTCISWLRSWGGFMRISFRTPLVHCIYRCVHIFLVD
jgi:hypothetical protein